MTLDNKKVALWYIKIAFWYVQLHFSNSSSRITWQVFRQHRCKVFLLDKVFVCIQLQKWTIRNQNYTIIQYYYCIFSVGVCLHFKTNHSQPKTAYLFHPNIIFKNCIRIANNSQKWFGILFGDFSKNPYKLILYKFSDNYNLL